MHSFVLMLPLLCALCGLTAAGSPSATAPDRDAAWREDLRVLVDGIAERHIDPFTRISRGEFEREAQILAEQVPQLSDTQIQVRIMQLVAKIGDSHTQVSTREFRPPLGRYPIRIAHFADGFFVDATIERHRAALAGRIVSIDGMDVDAAARRAGSVLPYENDAMFYRWVCGWLAVPEVLQSTGVISDVEGAVFAVRASDGRITEHRLSPRNPDDGWIVAPLPDIVARPTLQLSREAYYWFEHLPKSNTVYVRYSRCANDPRQMILIFSQKLFDLIDGNDVKRVVVDLRDNGGGNSIVLKPIVLGLSGRKQFRDPGRLIVLIGPGTYSSAMLNAWELKNHAGALLMGRPTGQKPNSFGEVRNFKLPNSGITVNYSTKRFVFFPDDDPPSLMPDVLVEPSGADYFSGRDVTLEAALAYEPD